MWVIMALTYLEAACTGRNTKNVHSSAHDTLAMEHPGTNISGNLVDHFGIFSSLNTAFIIAKHFIYTCKTDMQEICMHVVFK